MEEYAMHNHKYDYFNTVDYLDYLKKNFDSIDLGPSGPDETCKRPDIELIFNYTELLRINAGESLLEIGCGLGRLLDVLGKRYCVISGGVDVSEEAVRLAHERLPEMAENIKCVTAEALPFPDSSFDHILCWAVFDLTDQGRALSEMIRVLKPGGEILLTGKNDLFMDDDDDALIAETKSREKGIPNHYTNYDAFRAAIEVNGCEMVMQHFFLRRGDFMRGAHLVSRPAKFIEYCVIIRKNFNAPQTIIEIAETHSRTWKQKNE